MTRNWAKICESLVFISGLPLCLGCSLSESQLNPEDFTKALVLNTRWTPDFCFFSLIKLAKRLNSFLAILSRIGKCLYGIRSPKCGLLLLLLPSLECFLILWCIWLCFKKYFVVWEGWSELSSLQLLEAEVWKSFYMKCSAFSCCRVITRKDSVATLPRFEFWLHYFPAVWSWTSSLDLSDLMCKKGLISLIP